MERVPIELWEQILLKVMEMDEAPIFATSCTPYTFLYFVNQQTRNHWHRKPHHDYLKRRRRLRLVCRTWNEFVLSTGHRWLQLGQWDATYDQARLDDYQSRLQGRSWSRRGTIHNDQIGRVGDPCPVLGVSHSQTPRESLPLAGLHPPTLCNACAGVQSVR